MSEDKRWHLLSPILLRRKNIIQFSAAALGSGAAVGVFGESIIGIVVLTALVFALIRWRLLWIVVLCFGIGLLRGWAAPPDEPQRFEKNQKNVLAASLERTKEWLTSSIKKSLPSPEAPLLAGLLLGSREEIPKELRDDFRVTGTSHIVAVSGYNVTIVVGMIAALVRALPLPRVVRTLSTFFGIVAFVILTGASPSVVRAGIMGSLVVLAREVGRLSDALHALVLAASAMVFADPRTMTSIGFQLSVVATLGLVVFAERFEERMAFVPSVFGLRSALASTLAAILATQPLILLYFGQISVVAPFVNLIVLPIIPLAMLTGFGVALVSGIVPLLGPLIGWIAWLPLTLIVEVVHVGASLPFASVILSAAQSLVLAVVFAAGAAFVALRVRRSYATA